MGLGFPRDMLMEMSMGGVWTDITALHRVRQTDAVTLTWGANSEQGKIPPAALSATLENGAVPAAPVGYQAAGMFTPGNPMSPWSGYLDNRNVPVRWSQRVMLDTATRTVANDWGTSDTGEVWARIGSPASDWSVGSGTANHVVGVANSYHASYIEADHMDGAITASGGAPTLNVTGASLEPLNLILRYQRTGPQIGQYYMLRIECTAAELLLVSIMHSNGTTIAASVIVPDIITDTVPKKMSAWFQVEGQTLRAVVWPTHLPMPNRWTVQGHSELINRPGAPGIRSGVAFGNTNLPVTFQYDNIDFRLVRFTGELSKLAPIWDTSHRIKTAAMKATGITQRLGRPTRPALSSAIRRHITSPVVETFVTDAWMFDELESAPLKGQNIFPAKQAALFKRYTGGVAPAGDVKYGATGGLPSVPAYAEISNDAELHLVTDQTQLSSVWSVTWAMRLSPDCGGRVRLTTATSARSAYIIFFIDGTYSFEAGPFPATVLGTGIWASGFGDLAATKDQWHTFGVTMFNNGGNNIGYHLNVDGQALGVGNWAAAGPFSALKQVELVGPSPQVSGSGNSAYSSVIVTPDRLDDFYFNAYRGYRLANITRGWEGESALSRAQRLTTEEGVPFDYWGPAAQTDAMGPQRPLPLLDLIQECADVDGGPAALLYEPRYTAGLAMRPRRTVAAQDARATLDYSARVVAPPFAPSADDRPSANLVRAERIDGGFFVLEQTTGPMNTGNPGGTDGQAIGRAPSTVKANVQADAQLGDQAGWAKALGTNPEIRFPKLTFNLRAPEITDAIAAQILGLNLGDRVVVQNLTAADIYRPIDQIVRGGTETWENVRKHKLTLNTAPYEVYRAGVFGDATSRYDTMGSQFASSLTTTTTGARTIDITAGRIWSVDAANYPLDIICEGEVMTVSGVTGAATPQTLTISARSVNGVVKSHLAGAKFSLYQPNYYA